LAETLASSADLLVIFLPHPHFTDVLWTKETGVIKKHFFSYFVVLFAS
jgi:hypothetical protein